MIQLKDITKSFGSLQVLRGINLQIERGEVVAIVGPSGAGKTTLLQIMGTLDKPDDGQVLIDGQDVFRLSGTKLSRFRNEHIGFVFQFHQLLPEFTALENIMIPAMIGGTGKAEARRRAMELLEFMGIAALKDSPVTQLSGGEQTRVAICRALINQPSILLADEPTGQLDAANAQTIAKLFQRVNSQLHTTIIMATHSAEMAKVAQKNYQLVEGKLKKL